MKPLLDHYVGVAVNKEQRRRLDELHGQTGLTVSEHVRRAIDLYYERHLVWALEPREDLYGETRR